MFDAAFQQFQDKLPRLPRVVIENSLKHDIDELIAMHWRGGKIAVVSDQQCMNVLGEKVVQALRNRASPAVPILLPGTPQPDDKTAQWLRQQTQSHDVLIAVGSGTINDLCKYVSSLDKKPYAVFPTAASMNGYLSANASITVNGHKKTVAARMPEAVFCDLLTIANAPPRLNKSGLGDSLARPTAQADWLLSHLLLGTPYDDFPFAVLKPLEMPLHQSARGIALADSFSLRLLLETLLLSGLGMTVAGGSYPASQGEHMIAHGYHMLLSYTLSSQKPLTFHGEEIGVTTLTMAALQEILLHGKPSLASAGFEDKKMLALFGKEVSAEAKKAFAQKQEQMRNASTKHWHDVAEKIVPILIPAKQLRSILEAAQSPMAPEHIGWNPKDYDTVVTHARFLRERFTFLDLA